MLSEECDEKRNYTPEPKVNSQTRIRVDNNLLNKSVIGFNGHAIGDRLSNAGLVNTVYKSQKLDFSSQKSQHHLNTD